MEKLKSFFRFTSRERLAILLLCLLMVLFWTLPLFFPEKPPNISMPQSNASQHNASRSNSYAYGDAAPASNAPVLGIEKSNHNQYSNSAPTKVAHYFPFNPNTASPQQWQELGLRDKTILTIQHYLQKGGSFRKPEDLRKIWGLKPEEADLLIPYVQIPTSIAVGKRSAFTWENRVTAANQYDSLPKQRLADPIVQASVSSNPEVATPLYRRKTWNLQPIDINLAGTEAWMAFPGIGEVLAARIVKFRDKMGGFKSIDQVGKTYGIRDSLFQLMKPLLILEQAPTKKD
jgi:DNA uptake protein ComE-like DNA-binding protein